MGENKHRNFLLFFTNTDYEIIESIKLFIQRELGIVGITKTNLPRKETHNISYDLIYRHDKAYQVLSNLESFHSKKEKKIRLCHDYKLTMKKSKYTEEESLVRNNIIQEFFNL